MPTKNPRIAVTVKPETAAVLMSMSRLSKKSVSAIVGELVEQGVPIFERVVKLLQLAQEAKEGASARVVEGLGAAQAHIEAQLGLVEQDLTARSDDLLTGLEDIQRRKGRTSPGRAAARASPPLLTGGVETPKRLIPKGRGKTKAARQRGKHGRKI